MTVTGILLLGFAGLLLAINVAGDMGLAFFMGPNGDMAEKNPGSEFDCRSFDRFLRELGQIKEDDPEKFFITLSRKLTQRFHHGLAAYSLGSDYVFRAVAWRVPWLKSIEVTDFLFRYSQQALCHQMAQSFVDAATRLGRSARIASLQGHVIAEAFYDDEWHAFDPDYGVIFRDEGRIVSLDELVGDPELAEKLYREHRFVRDSTEVLEILARGRVLRIEPGVHLSPDASRRQVRLHTLRWIFPLLPLALGIWALI